MNSFTNEQKEEIKRKVQEQQSYRKEIMSQIISKNSDNSDFAGDTEDDVRKNVRNGGFASLVWGLIWIILGVISDYDPILFIGGCFLIMEGSLCIIIRQPALMILDAITLIAIGILNVVSSFAGASPGRIGIFQIVWGVKRMLSYSRWKHSPKQVSEKVW